MSYTNVLSLIGGLCIFLFGMQVMGNALEKRAGSKLRGFIGKLTNSRFLGFLTGMGVTAVIQSSSATTVMVVGFVNSGVMTLSQAINVIMGANVGTTVTAWLLSLSGVSSSNPIVAMFKPSNFTPILALIGIILYMFCKDEKKQDTGTILLGFATLMFGMEAMSGAVSGLRDVPEFQNILIMFSNPILGVLAGAFLTAVIQSSSASVGILQALSSTGQVTVGTAIPIIFGQNIGTCVTAMLSSIGANKNAKRAAVVHLSFNLIGCAVCLAIFYTANAFIQFSFTSLSASTFTIAVVHSIFNVACTIILFPFAGKLEVLAKKLIPDEQNVEETNSMLDERLLNTPSFAMDRCRSMSFKMAECSQKALGLSMDAIHNFSEKTKKEILKYEDKTDRYEDTLGSYLVKLSSKSLNIQDSSEANKILHLIGSFERIADHAVNIAISAQEMSEKELLLSEQAKGELDILISAVQDIVSRTTTAYKNNDLILAKSIEPLEEVIDGLKSQIRSRHILRLQSGSCSLEAGFILADLLTDLERVAAQCSNIAGCMIEMSHDSLEVHEYLDNVKHNSKTFQKEYQALYAKYILS